MKYFTVEPLDGLHLRGNRLFSDASHAEPVMPPWPSAFAGALRTRILIDQRVDLAGFRVAGALSGPVADAIGRSASEPGTFRIAGVGLVSVGGGGQLAERLLFPLPADLLAEPREDQKPDEAIALGRSGTPAVEVHRAKALDLNGVAGVRTGCLLPRVATIKASKPFKPRSDLWIDAEGYCEHLAGTVPAPSRFVPGGQLWKTDFRLGVALDEHTRATVPGRLYSSDLVTFAPGVRFVVAIDGDGDLLQTDTLVKLGGDGRAAHVKLWRPPAVTPWAFDPGETKRFRMILASPGIFPGGWLPPGVAKVGEELVLSVGRCRARLLAARMERSSIVSGWDLARDLPKPAVRTVPAGSVYWFEWLDGAETVAPREVYPSLLRDGVWCMMRDFLEGVGAADRCAWMQRRAEGFGNVWLGRSPEN